MRYPQPNIVFILLDDLGWRDLQSFGSPFYETPNIDSLAREGIRFTEAYASAPVCSPARASILSGKYPARIGLTNWIGGDARGKLLDAPYVDHLPAEECSMAEAFRNAGYQTWYVGKWHLGDEPHTPESHGFDVNVGGSHWGSPYQGFFSPYGMPHLEDGPEGEYLTDRLTDEAISLIRQKRKAPFFLFLSHYAVHTPIQAKDKDVQRFRDKATQLGLHAMDALEEGETFPCEHKKHLKVTRRKFQSDPDYAAMIWNLDENIGRLLAALEETGERDQTLIVFTSDNGGLSTAEGSPTTNAPLHEGKGWMYEGGVRVPLIIHWPRAISRGALCSEPITGTDFYPTLLEAAGIKLMPQQHCDGISFLPLLHGETSFQRGAIFWHYPHYGNQGGTPGCSIREGDYKLIEFFEDGRLELYNLKVDPSEQLDLSEAMQDLALNLHAKLVKWRESVGALLPEMNPDYK